MSLDEIEMLQGHIEGGEKAPICVSIPLHSFFPTKTLFHPLSSTNRQISNQYLWYQFGVKKLLFSTVSKLITRPGDHLPVIRWQRRRAPVQCAVFFSGSDWQDAQKSAESHGGQFPSHPGRPGPETSSEGTHLTPNPQEIQADFSPPTFLEPSNLFVSIAPSVPPSRPSSPRRQKSPVNSKHLYGQGPIRELPFPEPMQMKFYSLHEKIAGGGGERKQKTK